jgi:hypothetical protein
MATPAGPQYVQVIDTTGPQVGATIEYQTTGGAAQAVYSDSTLLTSLGATLSGGNASDSKGRFPIHWLDPSLSYKRIIKLSDGSTWRTDNPVQTADTSIATALLAYVAKAGGDMTGPLNFSESASVTAASSINLNNMTGNFGHVTGATAIDTMVLQQGAWRILVFDSTPQINHSSNLLIEGQANVTVVAGDACLAIGEGVGVTRLVKFFLIDGKPLIEPAEILIAVGDESTALAAGTAKITFRMPFAMTLDAIPRGSLTTASSSGVVQVDINLNGTTIFSTELQIDENELTSTTAGTPAVLSTTSLTDDGQITIDIVSDGTNAAGLKCLLRGYRRNRS